MNSETNQSLENGTAGRYQFGIKAIFGEAWDKVSGIKGSYWAAIILMIIITVATMIIVGIIGNLIEAPIDYTDMNASFHPVHNILQLAVSIFITFPMSAGIWIMLIRHISGLPTSYKYMFKYFSYWKNLWIYPLILMILGWLQEFGKEMPILSLVGVLLMLFFYVTYFMFIPLVAEKKLAFWPAMEASRKTIFHHWFKMLWFIILMSLILMLSLCTLGIALIWTGPWVNNAMAILYRNMFGVQEQ